jgi:two-component system LytT family response regulator
MSVIRVLIVDDEPLAREGLRLLLEDETDVEVVGEASDGTEAIAAIESLQPALVFLDVQMPGMSGLEVLEQLDGAHIPEVIFVTAYDQYALRAFEHHALDYLLKPFDDERFQDALTEARKRIRERGADRLGQKLIALLAEYRESGEQVPSEQVPSGPAPSPFAHRLAVRTSGRIYFLRTEEIDWIEAADYYVKLHVGTKSHLMRESMNQLEKQLDPDMFLRVHRSSIVNLDRVKELHAGGGTDHAVVLQDGTRLKLSRSRRERLNRLLNRR